VLHHLVFGVRHGGHPRALVLDRRGACHRHQSLGQQFDQSSPPQASYAVRCEI
jgi:hypothetical protein